MEGWSSLCSLGCSCVLVGASASVLSAGAPCVFVRAAPACLLTGVLVCVFASSRVFWFAGVSLFLYALVCTGVLLFYNVCVCVCVCVCVHLLSRPVSQNLALTLTIASPPCW